MKRLNETEQLELMKNFTNWTLEDVKEVAELFYRLKRGENYRLKNTKLENVNDYIEEYCNSWYSYKTFGELVESEREQGVYALTENECREEIGKSIFKLKSGKFIQCVY